MVADENPQLWLAKLEEKIAEVQSEMQSVRPETHITISERFFNPGLRPETDGEAEALTRGITGDNAEHVVSTAPKLDSFKSGDIRR